MSSARAAALIALVALVGAGVVAFVSRTPPEVRAAEPGPAATDPSLGASFSDEQISRHGAYRGPSYLAFFVGLTIEIVTLVALARGPLPRLASSLNGIRGGLPVRVALIALFVAAVATAAALPLSYVRGYAMQKAWSLSTQNVGGWLSDVGRGFAVSAVIAAISAIVFYGLLRWQPRTWWVWGWAAFSLLSALLVFLYPVVIAPLFNKFTPLQDAELAADIRSIASDAGVDVDEVLVADASRRTTAENAYVAGLGSTKRVVVYDTFLEGGGREDTLFVVAHELGHAKENHVLKNVGLSCIGLAVGFGALYWLAARSGVWRWAGAEGIADPTGLPVILLFATVMGVLSLPAQNAVSRSFERAADRTAFSLLPDPDPAIRSFRRLAFSNLADLRPPAPVEFLFFTHPSIPDRIETARSSARP
ncbi:MAG: M48 family metallopeptidase [Actinomycetota bacterium]|nr:M48 family metallopeptidase [Actinomycetota bacterium]